MYRIFKFTTVIFVLCLTEALFDQIGMRNCVGQETTVDRTCIYESDGQLIVLARVSRLSEQNSGTRESYTPELVVLISITKHSCSWIKVPSLKTFSGELQIQKSGQMFSILDRSSKNSWIGSLKAGSSVQVSDFLSSSFRSRGEADRFQTKLAAAQEEKFKPFDHSYHLPMIFKSNRIPIHLEFEKEEVRVGWSSLKIVGEELKHTYSVEEFGEKEEK